MVTPYHHPDLEARLLRCAAEIVATRGLAALSLRELGRVAGVSRTAAYHYFADKEDLLARVGALGFRRLEAAILAAADHLADSAARIRGGLQAYLAFALDEPHVYRLMLGDVLARPLAVDLGGGVLAFSSPEAESAFRLLVKEIGGAPETPPAMVRAQAFWGLTHGVAMLALGQNLKHAEAAQVLDHGLDLMLTRVADRA